MSRLSPPFLILLFLFACKNPASNSRLIQSYNWPDSLVTYKIYPDSIQFTFVNPAHADSFSLVEIGFGTMDRLFYRNGQPTRFKITANKFTVPIHFDTTDNYGNQAVFLRGEPADGYHLRKYQGKYVVQPPGMYTGTFSSNRLHLWNPGYKKYDNNQVYIVSFDLFRGKDSIENRERFKNFTKDSFNITIRGIETRR